MAGAAAGAGVGLESPDLCWTNTLSFGLARWPGRVTEIPAISLPVKWG